MNIYRSAEGEQAVKDKYHQILELWPVSHARHFVETRHGRTFVIASGRNDAPALILFHGSGSNSISWMGDVAVWAQHFRVYCVDMIGEPGLSANNRLKWDDLRYIEWVDDLFSHFSIETAGLIGMSLGGWMALRYAAARPEKIDKLILIAPGGLAPARISFLVKVLFYFCLGNWGKQQIGKLVGYDNTETGSPEDSPAMPDEMMEFIEMINSNFIFHQGALPVITDAELSNMAMPFLMYFGDNDALLNASLSCHRVQTLVANADVRLLPAVGHVILQKTVEISEFLLGHQELSSG